VLVNEALRWRRLGISCVPIQSRNKHFDKWAMRARGYKLGDLKEQLPSIPDLLYWFSVRRKLALMTRPDFVCVDFDHVAQYNKFMAQCPELTYTTTVQTPAQGKPSPIGVHLYYFLNAPVKDIKLKSTWPDIEIKYDGATAITYGNSYQTIIDSLPLKLNSIFDLPFVEVEESIPPRKKENGALSFFAGKDDIKKTTNIESELVKHHVPIDRYLNDLGFSLKKTSGGKFVCSCPFPDNHKNGDRKPSFWIDPQFRNCNCNKPECKAVRHMDLFDLYMRQNNCNFQSAIYDLATAYGLI